MRNFHKLNSAWVLFISLGIIYYFVGPRVAILLFVVFCQIVTIKTIVRIRQLVKKSRTGSIVEGKIIRLNKIGFQGETEFTYMGTIQFSWPDSRNEYFIEHGLISAQENDRLNILVNEKNPEKSVVFDSVRSLRRKLLILVFVTLFLFIVDYYLIEQIR